MKTNHYRLVLSLFLFSLIGFAAEHDAEGLTPLHRAAGRGDTRAVRALLDRGADLFSLDSRFGVSVLHKAVYSGNPETVELLLQRGALVDLCSPSNGDSPLQDAIYFKAGPGTAVIRALLNHGASLTIRNRAGLTPLESARLLKQADTIAELEAADRARHTDAGTRLMAAVRAGDLSTARALLAEKATPIEEADEEGFTPLLWAARSGLVEITTMLLDRGADPNRLDHWMGANAGHKAAY